jgi:hypothetical protein
MQTVITVTGVTPDPEYVGTYPGAVREWCINSAAIDPANKCAVVNSEDGKVYRWDFTSNSLSAGLTLAAPTGEAYTPTVVGPDGAIYAINDATIFSAVAVPSTDTPAMPPWALLILTALLVLAGAYSILRGTRCKAAE